MSYVLCPPSTSSDRFRDRTMYQSGCRVYIIYNASLWSVAHSATWRVWINGSCLIWKQIFRVGCDRPISEHVYNAGNIYESCFVCSSRQFLRKIFGWTGFTRGIYADNPTNKITWPERYKRRTISSNVQFYSNPKEWRMTFQNIRNLLYRKQSPIISNAKVLFYNKAYPTFRHTGLDSRGQNVADW